MTAPRSGLTVLLCMALAIAPGAAQAQRTFATPEEAVRALTKAAAASNVDDLLAIFGPGSQELIDSSDVATARKNREVFVVAAAEGWHLVDQGTTRKTLVIGNEDWQDHREDLVEDRSDRAKNAQENRTERAGTAQEQRTERTEARQGTGASATNRSGASAETTRSGSTYESRGHSQTQDRTRPTTTQDRTGRSSDAFSGYSSGKSERAASSRGKSSRSSSRSKSGGGRRR